MKVTISYSEHITENYRTVKIPFLKIMDLVKSKFNYSAGLFKDGYRNKDNYLSYADLIILDIDDGLSIENCKMMFEAFTYIIATTKSHQKEKNGKVCDRYRLILPTETPITLNKDDFSKMMEEVYIDYPFVDTVCKDASRFYYPSPDATVFHHQGFTNFDWEYYHKKSIDRYLNNTRLNMFKSSFVGYKEINNFEYGNGEKIDYVRSICMTEKILKHLKFNEKFVSGQRNKTLYSYAKYFQDLGFNDEEIKKNIFWLNSQGDSISENEIIKTILRSLKI